MEKRGKKKKTNIETPIHTHTQKVCKEVNKLQILTGGIKAGLTSRPRRDGHFVVRRRM